MKHLLGGLSLTLLSPWSLFARSPRNPGAGVQLLKKAQQFNELFFDDQLVMNKPVFPRQRNVQPYSSLLYWSNEQARGSCAFPQHPHQGFEIMTFLFAGETEHFDTVSRRWTTLYAGDFQIIQSNSGIEHQEKIGAGAKYFQIWFDPNLRQTVQLDPTYIDYRAQDFAPRLEQGIPTLTYVGPGSKAQALTPQLVIKKLVLKRPTKVRLALDTASSYTFYVLQGQGTAAGFSVAADDALRIRDTAHLDLDFQGELFYVQTPTTLDYQVVTM